MLDAIGQHQRWRTTEFAVVAQHERVVQSALVAGESGRRRVVRRKGFGGGFGRIHPARHGEIDALQPDAGGEAHRGGVSCHQHPVAGHLRHHRQARLGDHVRRVLLDLAAFDERGNAGMDFEVGDDLLGPQFLSGELRELQHDADRQRVEVGVDEAAAVHTRGAAEDLDVDAFAIAHAETLVDHVLRERNGFLDADGVVGGIDLAVETGLLGEEAVHAIAGDHEAGMQVTVGTVGGDSSDVAPLVAQQAGGRGGAHQLRAVGLGLARQPVVPVGSERRGAVVRRLGPVRRSEVDGEGLGVGEHHRGATRDPTLDGRLVPPLGVQLVEDARVHDAAVHVLRSRERTTFEQDHRVALAGQHGRRRGASRTGTDDDHVDRRHVRLEDHDASWADAGPLSIAASSRRSSSSSVSLASATMARSDIVIIGQCGSVLTLMM